MGIVILVLQTSQPTPAVSQLLSRLRDAHSLPEEVLTLLQAGGGLGASGAQPLASTTGLRSTTTPSSSFGTTQAASAREPGQVSIDSASGDAGEPLFTTLVASGSSQACRDLYSLKQCVRQDANSHNKQGRTSASADIRISISPQGSRLH